MKMGDLFKINIGKYTYKYNIQEYNNKIVRINLDKKIGIVLAEKPHPTLKNACHILFLYNNKLYIAYLWIHDIEFVFKKI